LNLANTQRDILQEYAAFMISTDGEGATLSQKIDELERSLPEIQMDARAGATTAPSNAASTVFHPETAGIFGLIGQMLLVSENMSEMKHLEEVCMDLRQSSDKLRQPMRQAAIETMRASEVIGSTTQPSQTDPAQIESHGMQIDALTDQFKQLSSGAIPLAEQLEVLDASREALIDWHSAITRQYDGALHALLLRLGTMLGIILVIFVISELWKRATFRYVRDARRQRQIVFVRRIVIGLVVLIIVIASVVTEFGSLATFAGLITAGVAVALQTVILSGVAYFFFIGRFGVRVGDRVTISGITGDVIEIGLFRIYLMELGGNKADLHPTGRVVVFSNSVLFQPSAFYKQLPGSDYVWHEVALTLTPESDPDLAEQRLLAAVQHVFADYKEAVETQHAQISRSLHVDMGRPEPEGRLRFMDAGLEFIVRYPVELHHAAEIDERITRELLKVINHEPDLKVIAAGTPRIRPA
jgi:small-conductance mechanosensitive channel